MNKKHAGVPVLLYEITTTYCSSYLSLNGNLYVLNVRVLVRALMMQEIMRSRNDAQCNTMQEMMRNAKQINHLNSTVGFFIFFNYNTM